MLWEVLVSPVYLETDKDDKVNMQPVRDVRDGRLSVLKNALRALRA